MDKQINGKDWKGYKKPRDYHLRQRCCFIAVCSMDYLKNDSKTINYFLGKKLRSNVGIVKPRWRDLMKLKLFIYLFFLATKDSIAI